MAPSDAVLRVIREANDRARRSTDKSGKPKDPSSRWTLCKSCSMIRVLRWGSGRRGKKVPSSYTCEQWDCYLELPDDGEPSRPKYYKRKEA